MTRDDIIKMAKESGLPTAWISESELTRFVALVAAAEREECARVCEQPVDEIQITDDISQRIYKDAFDCAEAIRARGE